MIEPVQRYREKIRQLAEPVLEAEGMELIDVECIKMKSRWLVRIFLDKEGGVTLDDCTEISNQLGDLLDVHDLPPDPYTLEVSSPGLNRPLVRDRDFVKYTGCRVDIRLSEKIDGIGHFKGKLTGFFEEEGQRILTVDVSGRTHRIPKDLIVKARLEYEF
jgi:ribosome maturation factor RimP